MSRRPTCRYVVDIHRNHCGQPATAVVLPPPPLPDDPLPVCAGHGDQLRRTGFTVQPMGAATLWCPACGINRHWDEEDAHGDGVDHWPGTGMALPCPRCRGGAHHTRDGDHRVTPIWFHSRDGDDWHVVEVRPTSPVAALDLPEDEIYDDGEGNRYYWSAHYGDPVPGASDAG